MPFGRQIQAEAAFSVETEHRRRGIGEKLFRRIQRAATNHGVETIEIICLPDNIGVRMLARKFKTHFTFEESALTGRLRAWRPTAFSLRQSHRLVGVGRRSGRCRSARRQARNSR